MQMKPLVGLAIAAALTTGGVANAAITNPGNNSGELFEVVLDNANGHVYVRGLQISFDTVLTPAQLQSTATYNPATAPVQTAFSFAPIAADANLKTFFAQDGGTDTFSYALLGGGQNLGNANPQLGPNKPGGNLIQFTSLNTLAAGNLPAMPGTSVQSAVGSLKVDVTSLNAIIGGNAGDGTSADVSTQFNANSPLFQLYGNNIPILANLGQNMNLYTQTGNSSASNPSQVYTAGLVTMLANGTVEAAAGAVPLPGAVWLLGSGLLGLAGIGRRRRTA